MRSEEITAVVDELVEWPYEARAANACIGRDRADLVLAGCAILEAIRRAFPSERLRIADRGLREGILMNLMREDGVWRFHERRFTADGIGDLSRHLNRIASPIVR